MRARVQFFRENFSKFLQKQCRKGEKHRSNHLKMFWEQGVLEIKKKKISKSTIIHKISKTNSSFHVK